MEDLLKDAIFDPDQGFKSFYQRATLVACLYLTFFGSEAGFTIPGFLAAGIVFAILQLEGEFLYWFLRRQRDHYKAQLQARLRDSSVARQLVTVQRIGAFPIAAGFGFRFQRIVRRADGTQVWTHYAGKLDTDFKAYLFENPKHPLNIWGQRYFVVPVTDVAQQDRTSEAKAA